MRSIFFAAFVALSLTSAALAEAQKPLTITRITPSGEDASSDRQIILEFNRAVVPLGRMERTSDEIPITISPKLDCGWRWINPSTLACQLGDETALTPATTYTMHIGTGFTAEDGAQLAKSQKHSFTTQRADVEYQWLNGWRSPTTPEIRVVFTQPVLHDAVVKHLSFDTGSDSIAVLAEPPQNTQPEDTSKGDAYRAWIISPAKEVKPDTQLSLKLSQGLTTPLGPEPSNAARELIAFDTFPDFALQGLTCSDINDAAVTILAGSAVKSRSKCDPQAPITLSFTSPVSRAQVAKGIEIRSLTTGVLIPASAWGDIEEDGYDSGLPTNTHRAGNFYTVSIPALKAAREYSITVHPAPRGFFGTLRATFARLIGAHPRLGISDRFGRGLNASASITFATDHRKPNFELPNHEAVIEQNTDSEIPFYVNNLKNASVDFTKLTTAGRTEKQTHRFDVPFVQDVQFAVPLGLREMLDGKSGAVYGVVSTEPEMRKSDSERKLFAQVTPYSIHAKIGHFESLVWVTDFATGKPVEGVDVSLQQLTLSTLTSDKTFDNAKTDANGVAILAGYASFDPHENLLEEWRDANPRIAVRASKGDAMALLPMHYDFEVDIYRASNETIYPSTSSRHSHMRAWGTTAQGVYRTGQTIDYKLYVRDETGRSLKAPQAADFTLTLFDPLGNEVHNEKNITLSRFGTFAGSYELSEHAPMGWYRFTLVAKHADMVAINAKGKREQPSVTLEPMRVLVSDFTPAPFKVTSELNGKTFMGGDKAEVTSRAALYSGGAYTDAAARITAQILPRDFSSKRFEGFSFSDDTDYQSDTIMQTNEMIEESGERTDSISLPENTAPYGTLVVESAVSDERGKFIANESRATYFGRDRFVGLKSPEWIYTAKQKASLLYGVADIKGEPVSGVDVAVTIEKQNVRAARVKSAGNSYQSEFITTWNKVSSCNGSSAAEAQTCSFTPPQSGYYRATATISDSKGRNHAATQYMWVTGSDYVQWADDANTVLPLVPEKTSYQVGDTARYLVRNPYPGATALITIERYGVIDHFVQVLEGSTPAISFEVKPDYLPGFYLSVAVISPRVDKPLKIGEVDLGKPAYRLGYVEVPVTDSYKEITVTSKAEKEEYRPRDTVHVTLHAVPKNTGAEGEPIEVAAIVLDEAVFDLISDGRDYFNAYRGLFALSGLDLKNYSLLTRLVGRQKFEKKGANPGGDGGVDLSLRSLFKFVAYWNPSLVVDSKGNANFSFVAPDNLTNWRVITIASTPNDRFGLGDTSFRVNRPTEIRPIMPNIVREGDTFTAQFSVMNRTDTERTLDVTIEAHGALSDAKNIGIKLNRKVTVAPYKRETISMPLVASAHITNDSSAITFTATAADASDGDAMEHSVPVKRALAFATAASMDATDDDSITTSLAFPKAMRGDVGEVRVTLSPSIIGNLEGAFRYIRDYPYACFEQRLTKALMADAYLSLKAYLPQDFEWKGAKSIPASTLKDAANFQAPNGGMAYFRAEDAYVDPYLSAYTAYAFNQLRASGHSIPEEVEAKLHAYLVRLLKKDVVPDWYDSGMRSDVRALALAALAPSKQVDASDIARFAPHMKRMSLFGKAQFLRAALALDATSPATALTLDAIRAKGIESAGTLTFNETLDDGYLRILASPLRDNCAVLSSFVAYANVTKNNSIEDSAMKLTRSITQMRGNRDYFENTQENLYCMQALVDVSRRYESVKPDMRVTTALNDTPFGETTFTSLADAPKDTVRSITQADVGTKANIIISKEGDGRLYANTRLTYAPTDGSADNQNAGITMVREYSVERGGKWVLLKDPAVISRGELVRVDLYASLPTARAFVVIDDAVAGGLEPVNRDLATSSNVDADKGDFVAAGGSYWFQFGEWENFGISRFSFYHRELGHTAVRFYSDYLPKGNYHLSYTAQAIATGSFNTPAARAEAMYDPDIFGSSKALTLTVDEARN